MERVVFFTGNEMRKPQYQVFTKAVLRSSNIRFVKYPNTDEAKGHLNQIRQNYKTITTYLAPSAIRVVPPVENKMAELEFEFIEGKLLDELLFQSIIDLVPEVTRDLISKYLNIIDSFKAEYRSGADLVFGKTASLLREDDEQCLAVLDCQFANIIISDEEWHLIDYEWVYDFTLPKTYLLARVLMLFSRAHDETFRYSTKKLEFVDFGSFLLPKIFLEFVTTQDIEKAIKFEPLFQQFVTGYAPELPPAPDGVEQFENIEPRLGNLSDHIESIKSQNQLIEELRHEIKQIRTEKDELVRHVADIKKSTSWRLGKMITGVLKPLRLTKRNNK